MLYLMLRTDMNKPLKETEKKMHDITRADFHALLKKAAKNGKPSPK